MDPHPMHARDESAAQPAELHPSASRESRTWEQELLISGAVLFGLFQLLGVTDDAFLGTEPHLSGGSRQVAMTVYQIVKIILFALVGSFSLHLIGRGFFVGLVGLDSVFPGGIRWDKVRAGPITREVQQQMYPPIRVLIARVDDVCSVIFSFAFVVVCLALTGGVGAVALGGLAYAAVTLLPIGWSPEAVFVVLYVGLFGPVIAAGMADKRIGDRLDPAGRLARAIRRITRVQGQVSGSWIWGSQLLTLMSNLPRRATYPLLAVAGLGLPALFVVDVMLQRDVISVGDYAYFPSNPDERGMHFTHYDDQRTGRRNARLEPSIQSAVVPGPYLRLFVPFSPRRHGEAIGEQCPEVRPLKGDRAVWGPGTPDALGGAASEAVLRCLPRIQRVWLNGRVIADPGYLFYTEPRTGIRGVIAYLPTAGMPSGRNLLQIDPAPRSRNDRPKRPTPPHSIPFWR